MFMQEFTTYSVISPEGCAAILWRDRKFANEAAEALKPTARDLMNLKLIDGIIPEPMGGAHLNAEKAAELMGDTLEKALSGLLELPLAKLIDQRNKRLRRLGAFIEES
jgi:acetyl-CoA carboxylase carboxyl transferase subunit alpha